MIIPFNKPYLTGKETFYIENAVKSGKISGNGKYTHLCQDYFKNKYGFGKCLLTSSCTDALEMSAILINIQPGDEVLMPSYTFVSTANAFILRGAIIKFIDSGIDNPNINVELIEKSISPQTKAIVVVHYAGIACNMDVIMEIASRYNLYVIEDAAQAIDNYYINRQGKKLALGSIGHFAAFSFHETKNIISGEGGMLVVNDPAFFNRSEIIWEKGTNRAAFFRGEINKYGWVDIGSSYLPSEITAAFLWAQIENLEDIQRQRMNIWNHYYNGLQLFCEQNEIILPYIPSYSLNNGHIFYLIFKNLETRTAFAEKLKLKGILAVFHYLSLHRSPFFLKDNNLIDLPNSDNYSDKLLRLPLYYDLKDFELEYIIKTISSNELPYNG